MARALLATGRHEEATREAHAAIALDPAEASGHWLLAESYRSVGQPSLAIMPARTCVELAPNDAHAHLTLAHVLMELGRPERREAVRSAHRAVELAPNDPNTHVMLGVAYLRTGRPGRARHHTLRALALDPEHPYALNNLAALDLGSGRVSRASHRLGSALRADPQLDVAQRNVQAILSRLWLRSAWSLVPAWVVTEIAIRVAWPWQARASAAGLLILAACYVLAHGLRRIPGAVRSVHDPRLRESLRRHRVQVTVLGLLVGLIVMAAAAVGASPLLWANLAGAIFAFLAYVTVVRGTGRWIEWLSDRVRSR